MAQTPRGLSDSGKLGEGKLPDKHPPGTLEEKD